MQQVDTAMNVSTDERFLDAQMRLEAFKASMMRSVERANRKIDFLTSVDSKGLSLPFDEKVHSQLDTEISKFYEIDRGVLFKADHKGVADVIRSFCPISTETAYDELNPWVRGETDGEGFRLFLKVGTDIHSFVEGRTSLMRAVAAGHVEAARVIFDHGVDIEARHDRPVNAPSESGDGQPTAVQVTVQQGPTALMVACEEGRWGAAQFLLEKGARVDVKEEVVRGHPDTPLTLACQAVLREQPHYGHALSPAPLDPEADPQPERSRVMKEVLQELLLKTSEDQLREGRLRGVVFGGGSQGDTLLHFAARCALREFAVTCLSRGLEVDVRAANFRRYSRPYTDILQNLFLDDAPMFTPLLDALSAGHTDVADLLFSRGADAKAMAAFEEERMKTHCIAETTGRVVKMLIQHEVDINARGRGGRTPLFSAIYYEPVTFIVEILLDNGADPKIRDEKGRDALEYVRYHRDQGQALGVPQYMMDQFERIETLLQSRMEEGEGQGGTLTDP
uniref:Uncharacterized protein n=1 Tax=Chromera velia CCMP2878 TaxID=1169474 RepID=A0A0K6S9K7_9ALVE|eukprot:Cvel_7753.t1-p1 / transcript=Cvel_7753.t1 / gene=Cvel_7753 / organism=Chromera_velia_CCMP2878 / gene_product=Ankyrin repeat and KH domain-containing protein 1, putative / transcript_product=Ankyrin repeat and KH domain-containing protein 1, putative / location=Cvel_scaffold413:9895-11583(-) / protein_length=506 / sequence_SO=supercontig / SO=protein_coding / is_pseudo=false